MQNIILALFGNKAQAFQAFSELKVYKQTSETSIAQALLVKKENGVIVPLENQDLIANITSKTLTGGLIGSLLGVLGGPFGVLLGGSLGALFGNSIGEAKTLGEVGLLYNAIEKMQDGDTAVLVLVSETNEDTLNAFFGQFDTEILRWDVAIVQKTVADKLKAELDAQNIEKAAEKRAKAQERETKFNEFKADIKQKFDELKAKLQS